jgi:molybdopterin synthase sulfur carrier subunit
VRGVSEQWTVNRDNSTETRVVRVVLPYHLRVLAGVSTEAASEVRLEVARPVTIERVLDALEEMYPMLGGTIREYGTGKRRAFLRFFACEEDWSHEPMDKELPEVIAAGEEPLLVVGAIAGG